MTDQQLVKAFVSKQPEAFEIIVDRYLSRLYNFIFQLTHDKVASEDIVQDVFVKVWKNISDFDQKKKFSTWIFAIAKNAAFDWLKKKKTIPFSSFENEDGAGILEYVEDESVLYSHEILQKIDFEKDVHEILSDLPVPLKTILLLHHKYGFSLAEISEILGHSANTTKSKYRRTIQSLRQKYSSKNVYFAENLD